MKRSQATDHWPWLVLMLLLVLSLGDMASRYSTQGEKSSGAKRHPASSMTGPSGATSKTKERSAPVVETDQPKIYHTGVKARVRVRTGETAVMGYYGIEPGKLELTIVTPKFLEDGKLALQMRTIWVDDSIALRRRAQELFPDIFELEKIGVMSQSELSVLLRAVEEDESTKTMMSSPGWPTELGRLVMFSSQVNSPGMEPEGTIYKFRADAIPGAEGFDLSVDYQHSGRRSEE